MTHEAPALQRCLLPWDSWPVLGGAGRSRSPSKRKRFLLSLCGNLDLIAGQDYSVSEKIFNL